MATAGNITAVLSLNASGFKTGLDNAKTSVEGFVSQITKSTGQVAGFNTALNGLVTTLNNANLNFNKFTEQAKGVESFNKFANGVKALATAIQTLGTNSETTATGVARVKEIIASMEGVFGTAEVKVTGLANALRSLQNIENQTSSSAQRLSSTFKEAQQSLLDMGKGVQPLAKIREQADMMKAEFEKARAEMLQFAQYGVNAFNQIDAQSNKTKSQIQMMANEFERAKAELMEFARSGIVHFNEIDTAEKKVTASARQLSNATNQASASIQRQATANKSATASTNQLTSATSRLSKAMSSLRMMGTLVGSMLAYNFAHKLLVATGETIHAKSEMNGYFQMLDFGKRQINDFNSALDETIKKFPRLNKYALGETISSIGVEFELTTAEMKKAMPVVSMITSEYLRAGRNVNEASLAVKDILQGEFQRLSRETGVKGDQLKEAGWSGDKKDVMGLLEALDKVGKSRNWDVFVEKANSLNDAILILQNRFSEWSADMVERIQPTIVSVFNMLMGTAQKFASSLNGTLDWLNGTGIENQIAKWGLLATAISTVVTAFISYRTGAGLVQIAQMGLRGTIASTILGLEAETVATYGTSTAIKSKLLGLEAEKVAELSTKDAILGKILGLDAEIVAEEGLKEAITTSAFARELEAMKLRGATTEEIANTLALYENQLAQKSTIGLLSAQAMGLDMTTYATHGFTVALLEAKTGMKATEIASMSLAKKIGLLVASMGVPALIVGAFAVALGGLALQMNESAKQMEKFNDLVQNGSSIIRDAKDTVAMYTERQKALEEQLSKTKEGTLEYQQIQEKLTATNEDLKTSNDNLTNSIKAVELATSSQKHYEEALTDMSIQHQQKLAEAYMNAGYSSKQAYEMANESLQDAQNGAEQLRITLQKIKQLQEKGESNTNYLLGVYQANGVDLNDPETKKHLSEAVTLNDRMQKDLEKALTDPSFMGRMDGWLGYYEGQIESWINNLGATVQSGDWGAVWENLWKGIAHGFADLPLFKDFWGFIYEKMGIDKLKGKGWEGLLQALFGTSPLAIFTKLSPATMIWNWLSNALNDVKNRVGEWWESTKTSVVDGINQLGERLMECFNNIISYDYIGEFLKTWGLENFDFGAFWNDHVVIPLTNFFSGIDLIGMIQGLFSGGGDGATGEKTFNFGEIIKGLLDFATMDLSWLPTSIDTYIIQPLKTGLVSGIMNIPLVGTILSLFGLVNGENSGASGKGKEVGDSFKTKVEDIIRNIPILGDVLQFLGVIPQANPDARSKGDGVGTNVKDGFKNGLTGIVDIIKNELQHIIDAIGQRIDDAKSKAMELGNAVVSGVRNAIDPGSPGIIAREIIGNEFGTYIPQVIADNSQMAYTSAQAYGQSIRDGISSVNFNTLDGMATDYQNDAQIISATSQTMGMDTATAFDSMALAVNTTTSTMSGNVVSAYTTMGTKQASMLTDMKTKNTTAYNEMYQKSNQSLIQMRDSTSNLTTQMTNAWSHMKNQIVATANQLKTESTTHFNTLSNTIGAFYRKIQNPSNWGAGGHTPSNVSARTSRNPSVGRSFAHGITTRTSVHGAGGDKYTGSSTMSIAQLKRKLCPNGDCGNLFDGYSATDRVDVNEFLSAIGGEHGIGGWSGWDTTHYNHIKTTSDRWDTGSPVINLAGGISTSAKFKVGDFESGTPNISFSEFQSMAEAIFSRIPYRLYYDSSWKGSWLGALQAGACNCSDGADALIAFAHTCNPSWSADKVHGYWGSTGHFWAVINGKVMDTTAWQGGYGWTSPKVRGYGSPSIHTRRATHTPSEDGSSESVKVEVNINGDVYGIDDLNKHIEEGIDKGLQKHFNKSYAVGI